MIVRFGEWTLDSDQRLITGEHDIVVHLTPKAFDLLSVLVEAAPRVVRKDELHRRLWPGVFVSDATLAGLVKEVRHAFREPDHELSIIRTVHGVGYAFPAGMGSLLAANEFPDYWVIVGDRRVHLTSKEVVIGRDAASDVRLDSAGVSRRHARILMTSRGAYLEDLGSKNGRCSTGNRVPGRRLCRTETRFGWAPSRSSSASRTPRPPRRRLSSSSPEGATIRLGRAGGDSWSGPRVRSVI